MDTWILNKNRKPLKQLLCRCYSHCCCCSNSCRCRRFPRCFGVVVAVVLVADVVVVLVEVVVVVTSRSLLLLHCSHILFRNSSFQVLLDVFA